jgi:hypothetical protein
MKNFNYIYSLLLLIGANALYSMYKKQNVKEEDREDYEIVKKYLLNDSSLAKSKKPIIWIHNVYDINARHWLSFGSRNSTELNQPYLYLTIKSIIDQCGEDFNVCLIDDSSFKNILPGWTIDLNQIGDPLRLKIRELALAKVLYYYGGMLLPSSFICLKSLNDVYETYTADGLMCVGEFLNRNVTSMNNNYAPSNKLMACNKGCRTMYAYMNYLEIMTSKDFTEASVFTGSISTWFNKEILAGNIVLLSCEKIGTRDAHGKTVAIERLMENGYINFSDDIVGIYIPVEDLIKRFKYNWFSRCSVEQVLDSDTIIGKYLLLAQAKPGLFSEAIYNN